jgi:hypothetical protein
MTEADDSFLSRWSRRKVQARTGAEPAPTSAEPAAPGPAAAVVAPPAAASVLPAEAAVTDAALPAAGATPTAIPPSPPTTPAAGGDGAAGAAPPPPSLADVAGLTRESDYSRFVAAEVSPEVKNAALKKLFSDPHFNVMDGLDIYIDDYGKPDPLPSGMLRKMVQSRLLGLFSDDPAEAGAAARAPSDPRATRADGAAEPAADLSAPAAEAAPCPPDATAPEDSAAHEDADLQLQPDDAAGCAGPEPRPRPDAGREH